MGRLLTAVPLCDGVVRVRQQNFIDMEKLLELLDQNVEVQDAPDAKELVVTKGELEFGACRGARRRSRATLAANTALPRRWRAPF